MTTNDPQPKNSTGDILRLRDEFMERASKETKLARDLREQARDAEDKASKLSRQAQILTEAYNIVRQENSVVATAVATEKKLEELSKKDAAKIATARFVFLVDGSGSMQGAPIYSTVEALEKITIKLKSQGAQVDTFLFGDRQPVQVDLGNPILRDHVKRGLNSGTDLAPTLKVVAAGLKKNEKTFIVVVSDGDLFDGDQAKPELETALRAFPKTTLDVVELLGGHGFAGAGYNKDASPAMRVRITMMNKMIDTLDVSGPRLRPQVLQGVPEVVGEMVGGLLAQRLTENVPAIKKTPALKRPAAGK